MTVADIIHDMVYLGEGTMEVLLVDVIDSTVQPRTIELFPVLTLFQIVQERLINIIESRIVSTHLCFVYTLCKRLLILLLGRWLLLCIKGNACYQQSSCHYNLFET